MTRWRTFHIRGYFIEAAIEPRRPAPHVGADSPRYLEPGRPGRLLWCRILSPSRLDVTLQLDPAERATLERDVCQLAGISYPGAVESPLPPVSAAPLFSIREGGQGYIDWRGGEHARD